MKQDEIILIIDKTNLDEILSGKKTEEYRSLTDFYVKKFMTKGPTGEYDQMKPIKSVWLANGYSATRKMVLIEVKGVYIDRFIKFIPENFKKGDMTFTLELGKVLQTINP